ncbi:hypothetical protein C0583_03655 [Candidatus Parcubacteria bacterium]|nr:MAG: hypothetical protein C0583_03655 [Candidatus Parcubacteria bacterium]
MIGDKIITNKKAYTLVELMVSIAVFIMLMLTATSIFQSVNKNQVNAIAAQSVQESMRFALEMMSKELRSAQKSNDDCVGGVTNKVYNFENIGAPYNDSLIFKNRFGECVYYCIDGGRLMVVRNGTSLAITPDEVIISNLEVDIVDDVIGAFHSIQPKVTIKFDSVMNHPTDKYNMSMQTSISSRYYE